MKFCKYCKYYSRPILPNDIGWGWVTKEICKHRTSKSYDLITGDVKYKTCEEMRYIDFSYQINSVSPIVAIIRCGEEGRFFEPKE